MADVKELNINNTIYDIKAKSVVDTNSGAVKMWTGTKAQYEAIATKDSTTLYFLTDVGKIYFGDTLISNVGSNTLLDFKWTDHQLNDIRWLRADTFSWQSGDVYVTAYNHLVQDIQGITAETETIGSNTVTFYRATDGHKICLADQEQTVLNIYNTYGIAWYYILDTTNTQFKLPRTKYGFEGLRTNVGDKIDESLPNINGTLSSTRRQQLSGTTVTGCIYKIAGTGAGAGFDTSIVSSNFGIDASRSSSTYQDNAPVQERATQMYLYFYVGDYTQTAIEQTAGLNSELFNGKADVNLNNVPASKGILTESYVNGASWYRIYSDGWCEQGGITGVISADLHTANSIQITFLKPYRDSHYTPILSIANGGSGYANLQENIHNPTPTGMVLQIWGQDGSGSTGFAWRAEGYIN